MLKIFLRQIEAESLIRVRPTFSAWFECILTDYCLS